MNAPIRVSPQRFNELVKEFLEHACFPTGSQIVHRSCVLTGKSYDRCSCRETAETYACRSCGTDIQWAHVFMSMHDASCVYCTGFGDVFGASVPYCPLCEPRLNEYGCVHLEPVAGTLQYDGRFFKFVPLPPPPPTLFQRVKARLHL